MVVAFSFAVVVAVVVVIVEVDIFVLSTGSKFTVVGKDSVVESCLRFVDGKFDVSGGKVLKSVFRTNGISKVLVRCGVSVISTSIGSEVVITGIVVVEVVFVGVVVVVVVVVDVVVVVVVVVVVGVAVEVDFVVVV